jgi:hypothetical protein
MTGLPDAPGVSRAWQARLENLSETTSNEPPSDLAQIVCEELGVNLTARYGGRSIRHPFGKASGQLSCNLRQVQDDYVAGVAFVVLKTVIAEDQVGERTMREWVSDETRMQLEHRRSKQGRDGWTVTWKGRGWPGTLDEYIDFFGKALAIEGEGDMPVVPSVQYHLPYSDEPFNEAEYSLTTLKLLEKWDGAGCGGPMLLEKNMSPTLAAHDRAAARETVRRWLEVVPDLIHSVAPGRTTLGVKLMNAIFDDEFQVDMVRLLAADTARSPSYLVVFNRMFDVERGIAYGGWDLSDRNFRVLDSLQRRRCKVPPMSATGNICSGKVMLEYAIRGCENGQLHTFFQLPTSEYTASGGSRSARALHTLLLHPTDGLAVWLRSLHERGELDQRDGQVHFLDVVDRVRGTVP